MYTVPLVGLMACNINTSAPGTYAITFRVQDDSSGASASTTRLLVVDALCSLGEFPCLDGTCSAGTFRLVCCSEQQLVRFINLL